MAIDRVGWDWIYMANDGEDHALVANEESPTEFALMANTSTESKVFDNSLCSKDCKKNNDSLNSKITDLTDKLFDAKNLIYHYKLVLAQVEFRLVEYKEREVKYCEKIKSLEFYNGSNTECIEILKKKLETLKQEKEGVDGKLAGLLTASKDLDNLIESQRADKNKEGLGYSAVPPPPAQLYSSHKKDLSWTGLPECKDDTLTDYNRPEPTVESSPDDDKKRNPSVFKTVASPIIPKKFVKFVKTSNSQSKSKTDEIETPKKSPVKYAEQYRKTNKKPNVVRSGGVMGAAGGDGGGWQRGEGGRNGGCVAAAVGGGSDGGWRVMTSDIVDRVDRVIKIVFGFGRKTRRKTFPAAAGGGGWPEAKVVAGGKGGGGGE
nr:hypothetical protein [Tanacetum cinerariifolium]